MYLNSRLGFDRGHTSVYLSVTTSQLPVPVASLRQVGLDGSHKARLSANVMVSSRGPLRTQVPQEPPKLQCAATLGSLEPRGFLKRSSQLPYSIPRLLDFI